MTILTVHSSVIRAVGDDGYPLTVGIHDGRIYDPPGRLYPVYAGWMQASSKGAYYNTQIRGRHQ